MKPTIDDYLNLILVVIVFVLAIIASYGATAAFHRYFIEQSVKKECLK